MGTKNIQTEFENAHAALNEVVEQLTKQGYTRIKEPSDCELGGIFTFVTSPKGSTLLVTENGATDWHTKENYSFANGILVKNPDHSPV